MVTWPARLDTECHYLPTMVVPIYHFAFLNAFELLDWWELGQATGAHSSVWIQSYDCRSSDLAAQRLLRFNLGKRSLGGDRIALVKDLKGSLNRRGAGSALDEPGVQGTYWFKRQEARSWLSTRKNFLTVRAVQQWNQ